MTIALVIKVHDGLVIAADSATTLAQMSEDGTSSVLNIYNNANKIFNLHKGLPIGALTWGQGNIGPASISTLAKDLRRHFQTETVRSWKLDVRRYSIDLVAARVREFLYEEKYKPLMDGSPPPSGQALGFLTAGYSSEDDHPRVFTMSLGDPDGDKIREVLTDEAGAMWWGQPEAISRLLVGFSNDLGSALGNLGVEPENVGPALESIKQQIFRPLVSPAMPIQDAIDLARFLVETTIQFVRFSPGDPMVGGPVEVATITKHEGFKWVSRKHYFDSHLNPE